MALVNGNGMALGTKAPAFSLPGVDGKTWSLDDFADAEALVVVFTCNHCPYAKAAEDRLVALQAELAPRVRFVAINPNDAERYPADSFDAMKTRAKEKQFNFPYLFDESQAIARAYDATCTPDIFVFDRARELTYNGRLDDDWKNPKNAKRHDLRRAIAATLEGTELGFDVVPSMGCSIKWKAD